MISLQIATSMTVKCDGRAFPEGGRVGHRSKVGFLLIERIKLKARSLSKKGNKKRKEKKGQSKKLPASS